MGRLNNLSLFICLCPSLICQHFICTGPVKQGTHLWHVISIAQYKVLRENHVSDNAKCNDPEKEDNKLYKIQPVLDHVRQNCFLLEPGIEHSIDEQIIPTKTSYSGIH